MSLTRDIDPLIIELEGMQRDLKICNDEDQLLLESLDYTTAMSLLAQAEFGLRALRNRILQHALKRQEELNS